MVIAQRLNRILPSRFVAGPSVHPGSVIELDVGTFERDGSGGAGPDHPNGAAVALASPSLAVETDLLSTDEYAVRVYDAKRKRRLVAAVEIVSPANKDRAEHRRAFAGKCEAMLRQGVCVCVVDLVTSRHANLYAELLGLVRQADPTFRDEPPALYAASCRWVPRGRAHVLEAWSHALALGRPLPTLPLWVAENYHVPLELDATYEDTCRDLRID